MSDTPNERISMSLSTIYLAIIALLLDTGIRYRETHRSDLGRRAVLYARHGWKVHPLKPRSKWPYRGSHGFKDASNDPVTVARWWTRPGHYDDNIGLAIPAGTAIIDVDPRNGGIETLAWLEREHGPFPPTLTCLTGGGGFQMYYRAAFAEGLPTTLGPGIDVKRGGLGYVLLPPSIHPSGRAYRWGTR